MLLDEEERKKREEEAKKIISSVNINKDNTFNNFSNNEIKNFTQNTNDEQNYNNKIQEAKDIINSVYTKKNITDFDSNSTSTSNADTSLNFNDNINDNNTDNIENKENKSKIDLFDSGAFSDGYQFGDLTKTVLGTTTDIVQDLASGAASVIEAPIDIGANVVASIQDLLGFDEAAKKSREWANKNYSKKFGTLVANATPIGTLYHLVNGTFGENIFENEAFEQGSLLGETSDKIVNLVGYVGGLAYGGAALESLGASSNIGVNVAGHTLNLPTLAITGGMAGGLEEANSKGENVTELQRWTKAISGGLIEGVSEGLFGMFNIGGNELTDGLIKTATEKISSAAGKVLTKIGIQSTGEAIEELISYAGNYIVDNLIIDKTKYLPWGGADFSTKWNWEEVGEQMALAFASTVLTSGGSTMVNTNRTVKSAEEQLGRKLTDSEKVEVTQKAINAEIEANKQREEIKELDPKGKGKNVIQTYVANFNQDGEIENATEVLGKLIKNPNTQIDVKPAIFKTTTIEGYNVVDTFTGIVLDNTPYQTVEEAETGFIEKMNNLDNAGIKAVNQKINKSRMSLYNHLTKEITKQFVEENPNNINVDQTIENRQESDFGHATNNFAVQNIEKLTGEFNGKETFNIDEVAEIWSNIQENDLDVIYDDNGNINTYVAIEEKGDNLVVNRYDSEDNVVDSITILNHDGEFDAQEIKDTIKQVATIYDENKPIIGQTDIEGNEVRNIKKKSIQINSTDDIKNKYKNSVDVLNISENSKTISLDNMVVKENQRNKGIGTNIINDLIEYANQKGKTITLTPTTEFETKTKLINFYKSKGFVENKGKNTDFMISDTMYKTPNNTNQKELQESIIRFEKAKENIARQDIVNIANSLNIPIKDGATRIENTELSKKAGKNKHPNIVTITEAFENVTPKNATNFRKNAINMAMELFRDREVTIIDTDSIAEINKSGINKTFAGNVTVDKIQTANDIANIIEQGIYLYSTQDLKDSNKILYHHFFTPININKKNGLIRVVIKEFLNDKSLKDKYYYHQLEYIDDKKIEGLSDTLPHNNMEIRHFKSSPSTINNSITQKTQNVKNNNTDINNKSMQNTKNNTTNSMKINKSTSSNTQEVDNQGRRLTKQQQEFFKNSKIRDKQGKLKAMYHGTKRADRVGFYFDPNKATSGPMAFFTDDKEIASNYAKNKQDTSLSREYDTEWDLFKANNMNLDTYWRLLSSNKKQEIIKNGYNIGFDDDYNPIYKENASKEAFGTTYQYYLDKNNNNAIKALYEIFINGGYFMQEDLGEFQKVLDFAGVENTTYLDPFKVDSKVYEVYLNIENPFNTDDINQTIVNELEKASKKAPIVEDRFADSWDKTHVTPSEWIEDLKKDLEEGTTYSWTRIPDWVTDFFKNKGYDGIIDTGGKNGGKKHQVVIPFYSNQIKNIDNSSPSTNEDIRYLKKRNNINPTSNEDIRFTKRNAKQYNAVRNAEREDSYIEQEIQKVEKSGNWDNNIPITKMRDIRKTIEDYLGLGVKKGHFKEQAYGIYKGKRDVIRTKELKDMDSILHETGHAIDLGNRLKIDKETIADELLKAVEKYGGYETETRSVKLEEGFAEVIREYSIIPEQAKIDYPQTVNVLEKLKNTNENFGKFINTIQQLTYNYIHQNPRNRTLSNMSIGEQTDKQPLTKEWLKQETMRNIWDKDYSVKEAVKILQKAQGKTENQLKPSQNMYYLTRLASNIGNKVSSILSNGYIDENGNKLMPGLSQIGEILGNDPQRYDDLRAYLVAQRDLEYKAKTLKTGLRSTDSQAVIENFKNDSQIQEAAKVIYDTLDGVLQYAVNNKLISEEDANKLRKSNAFYVPMQRVIENRGNQVGKRGALADIIKTRTGSELDVKDVLENIVVNSSNIIQQVENNNILKALYNQGEASGLTGTVYDVIPAPMKKITTENLAIWEKELQKQGVDINKLDLDKTIDLFAPNRKVNTQELITSFIDDNGKRVYLQFNDELIFNSIMNMDKNFMSQVLKINSKLNMPLRYGATMANLGFAIPNMISDTAQASIYSTAGFIPVVDNALGVLDILTATNSTVQKFMDNIAPDYVKKINLMYALYEQSGSSSSTRLSQYRKSTQEIMKNIYGTKNSQTLGIQEKFKPLKRLLDFMTFIPEISEQSTRFRVYEKNYDFFKNKGMAETDSRIMAALESRDATQDFGRTGNLTREINQLIPFSAARIGSIYTFAEKAKANPKQVGMRIAIMTAIAMAIKVIFGYDDEVEELNQRKKDDNFVLKLGDDVVTIKKPQGVLRSMINLAEYIQDLVTGHIEEGKEGERLGNWLSNAIMDNMPADEVTGLVPNMVAPVIENAINKDLYYNSDIVKSYDLNLPNSEQYYDYNSQLSIWLGKIFNYSPAKIDNLISGYFGGLGTQITNIIDNISSSLGLSVEKPKMGAESDTIGKRFIVNVNSNSASLDEIYNRKTDLTKKQNGGTITEEEIEELNRITDTVSNISKINKQIKEIKKDLTMSGEDKATQIKELQKQRTDLARQALDKSMLYPENEQELKLIEFYPTKDTLSKNKYTLELTDETKKEYAKIAYEYYSKYEKQGIYNAEKLEEIKSKAKEYAKNKLFQTYRSQLIKP